MRRSPKGLTRFGIFALSKVHYGKGGAVTLGLMLSSENPLNYFSLFVQTDILYEPNIFGRAMQKHLFLFFFFTM